MAKLWLISQTDNTGYDTYSDAVVVAEDAKAASWIHPSYGDDGEWIAEMRKDRRFGTWTLPENVTVEEIGIASESLKLGTVVCASFHAG